jgi:hypothetical protein
MISKKYTDGESMTAHMTFFRNSNPRLANIAFSPVLVYHLLAPQSGRADERQQSSRRKSEEPPHRSVRHGRNWTHDTADCRSLKAAAGAPSNKQPIGQPIKGKHVAALITSPSYSHESDEERGEEGQCVLTVDENGNEAPVTTESALSIRSTCTPSGTHPSTGGTFPAIADTEASCHLWKEDISTLSDYVPTPGRYHQRLTARV